MTRELIEIAGKLSKRRVRSRRTPARRSSPGRPRRSMRSSPRWRLRMCLTMASPRPVPPFSRLARHVDAVEALGEARQVLGAMPGPSSVTATTTCGRPPARAGTRATRDARCARRRRPYLMAFCTRFGTPARSRRVSPRMTRRALSSAELDRDARPRSASGSQALDDVRTRSR